MREFLWSVIAVILVVACGPGSPKAPPAVDSAAVAAARADSLAQSQATAATLRDSAKVVMAELLTNPASATFDSLLVIQPPEEDGRLPSLVVCGRIGGQPGIEGRRTPTRFIYQNRFTVFVEEAANQRQFTALWARTCGVPGGTVLVEG